MSQKIINMQLNLKLQSNRSQLPIIDETVMWPYLAKELECIPTPQIELFSGIKWGYYSQLFTPAYWKAQYLMHNQDNNFSINYRLGENILEEVVACLLGGFGLKSEIGLAAFDRLKKRGQIKKGASFDTICQSLKEPFSNKQKKVHYRFPNQKAKFISEFLNRDDLNSIPYYCDLTFREWLISVNGIGPKTASWITRNFLNSENVAIIDVHIHRACKLMGLISNHLDIQKDYFILEKIFLDFCKKLEVQPSKMDALMWLQMKESNKVALKAINNNRKKQ
ncbi:hypothetical protein [Negadavirga shengliensis]|uniref:HhH-GPD domain-containing protein n=1 Tax=Negadavirga shengliensis TaxID=1389218 RepID=A0ABV9T092_9BACT